MTEKLNGSSDVEVCWNYETNLWEIRVGDEDYVRIFTTDIEPGVMDHRRPEEKE